MTLALTLNFAIKVILLHDALLAQFFCEHLSDTVEYLQWWLIEPLSTLTMKAIYTIKRQTRHDKMLLQSQM